MAPMRAHSGAERKQLALTAIQRPKGSHRGTWRAVRGHVRTPTS
jgi:hypothetical protein